MRQPHNDDDDLKLLWGIFLLVSFAILGASVCALASMLMTFNWTA